MVAAERRRNHYKGKIPGSIRRTRDKDRNIPLYPPYIEQNFYFVQLQVQDSIFCVRAACAFPLVISDFL